MLAIVETGGKQFKVAVGQRIKVEKLDVAVGAEVTFDKVCLVADGQGSTKAGTPFVAGAAVQGKALSQGKAKKIIVFKQKQRKGYRRKQGHRQTFTEVEITGISA